MRFEEMVKRDVAAIKIVITMVVCIVVHVKTTRTRQ